MKLTILKDNNYKRAFIEYVKEYTKKVFFKRIKPTRLVVITKYFNDNIKGKRKIDAFNLVILAIYNLTIIEYADSFTICVDNNLTVPYFDKTRLVDMCRLINYGNTDLTPYPIFTEVFNEVLDKIPVLYQAYKAGIEAH